MCIKSAPDQPPWVRSLAGTHCVVIRHLGPADGVISSPNIWEVLVNGRIMDVHALDLEPVKLASVCVTMDPGAAADGN